MAVYKFQARDPLQLDAQLGAEERRVRDTAQRYAHDRLTPAARGTHTPAKLFRELGEHGLLGSTLPLAAAYSGLRHVSYGLLAREIGRIDPNFRIMLGRHAALAMLPIHLYGTAAQRQKYLPKLVSGEWIGTGRPGVTVRDALRTPPADVHVIWVREGADAVRGFILDRETGIRCDDEENAFPALRDHPGPRTCLDALRYGSAWGALGAAEYCWHTARKHLLERNQFGRSLAANQQIQEKLAAMQTEITHGLQSCLRLGRLKDEGSGTPEATAQLRHSTHRKALAIAHESRDMLGGQGVSETFGMARHLANLESAGAKKPARGPACCILARHRVKWCPGEDSNLHGVTR
jgi:glutaryl-CoA dehydrogenase